MTIRYDYQIKYTEEKLVRLTTVGEETIYVKCRRTDGQRDGRTDPSQWPGLIRPDRPGWANKLAANIQS